MGKAMPSLAASLIERLPDEGDHQQSEERLAKNVAFVTYLGTWCGVHSQSWTSP